MRFIQIFLDAQNLMHQSIIRWYPEINPFEEIYDLHALRIIVQKPEQCYLALGLVHNLYLPVQDRFKDFIATPKTNGYQSIHTTVIGPKGKW